MCNPLLDISANVGQDMLDKYDVKLDSAILAEEKHLPIYQELVNKYSPSFIAGGAGQNSIRVAQWMTKTVAPGQTAFMGCVGNDAYGKNLEECATKDGVLVHYMIDETTPTGTCAALILGGERALIANLAAANNFKPAHLETDKAKEVIESAKFYYFSGFFLTVSVESLVQVAEHAVANDKVFCLNFLAPFIIDFFGDQFATALPYADYLFCNESEAAAYAAKHGLGDDLKQVALKVAAHVKKNTSRPRTVIFTQGSSLTIVACNERLRNMPWKLWKKINLWTPMGRVTHLSAGSCPGSFTARTLKNASRRDTGLQGTLFSNLERPLVKRAIMKLKGESILYSKAYITLTICNEQAYETVMYRCWRLYIHYVVQYLYDNAKQPVND